MITEIEINPAIFKCQSDEDIFYQELSTVVGIQKVITKNSKLYVTVNSAEKCQAIADIRTICDIWHTSFSTLS